MRKTLWELFLNADFDVTRIPWRIYGNRSHRLLCADYGSMKDDDMTLDNSEVIKATKKGSYWRIVIAD